MSNRTNTLAEMVEVITARQEGKTIQYRFLMISDGDWNDIENPDFNFGSYRYRVKPEPRVVYQIVDSQNISRGFSTTLEAADRKLEYIYSRGKPEGPFKVKKFVEVIE